MTLSSTARGQVSTVSVSKQKITMTLNRSSPSLKDFHQHFWITCVGQSYPLFPHDQFGSFLPSVRGFPFDFPIWMFPKIVVPQNGRFTMENPIKMDDLGVPLFLETPISHCISLHLGKPNLPLPPTSATGCSCHRPKRRRQLCAAWEVVDGMVETWRSHIWGVSTKWGYPKMDGL